ncbi:MAG: hypothetical protein AAB339_12690 [Elusimicrobiota bacterium]
MRAAGSSLVPLLLEFPESDGRPQSWGRFLELAATGGRMISQTRLSRGDGLRVSFSLPGESVSGLRADVLRARRDADGYFEAELRFLDEAVKVRLGRALTRLLASRP